MLLSEITGYIKAQHPTNACRANPVGYSDGDTGGVVMVPCGVRKCMHCGTELATQHAWLIWFHFGGQAFMQETKDAKAFGNEIARIKRKGADPEAVKIPLVGGSKVVLSRLPLVPGAQLIELDPKGNLADWLRSWRNVEGKNLGTCKAYRELRASSLLIGEAKTEVRQRSSARTYWALPPTTTVDAVREQAAEVGVHIEVVEEARATHIHLAGGDVGMVMYRLGGDDVSKWQMLTLEPEPMDYPPLRLVTDVPLPSVQMPIPF